MTTDTSTWTDAERELYEQERALREQRTKARTERLQAQREAAKLVKQAERAKRPELVASSAAAALAGKPFPAFDDFASFAEAAYRINGAANDPYFSAPDGVGLARFRRALRSDAVSNRLREQNMILWAKAGGVGVPDAAQAAKAVAMRQRSLLAQMETSNAQVDQYNQVLGLQLGKLEVKALTA